MRAVLKYLFVWVVWLTLICTMVIVESCEKAQGIEKNYTIPNNTPSGSEEIYQVEIEGCEYLVGYRKMTHKGNCSNPIHRK